MPPEAIDSAATLASPPPVAPTRWSSLPAMLRGYIQRPSAKYLALIILGIVVANALPLLGLVNTTPFDNRINLQASVQPPAVLPGFHTIDPNDGATLESLGRAAARSWVHGHIPYWNSNEGLGTPLAGEMQSGAFSPFVLLLLFHKGVLYLHILLECIAGVATFFVLKRLKIHPLAGAVGGLLFALNGTHAWLTNAVFGPIAFLPVVILGVECSLERVKSGRPGGFGWIACGLGLSLLAGFPEVAYINGLLVVLWSVIRLSDLRRDRWIALLRKLSAGAVLGVMLAAPVLIAFADFLQEASVGGHTGALGRSHLASNFFFTLLVPYAAGPIFGSNATVPFWGSVGGFVGVSVVVLAIYGLLDRRFRKAKLTLALFAVVIAARIFGLLPFLITLLNLIPGIKSTAFFRYSPPALSFALVVLAAFGLDRICRRDHNRVHAAITTGLFVALFAVAVVQARHIVHLALDLPLRHRFAVISVGGAAIVAGGLILAAVLVRRFSWTRFIAAGLAAFEAIVLFAVPQLSAQRHIDLDRQPIAFLQDNLGTGRFFSILTFAPNYGSYLNLAQFDLIDLPTPKRWEDFVRLKLNQNSLPENFSGANPIDPKGPTGLEEFYRNLANYSRAGVRYLFVFRNNVTPEDAAKYSLTRVMQGRVTEIYELPSVEPYFSAPGCVLTYSGRTHVSARCDAPATLTRLELPMPGWTAQVNGRDAPVSIVEDVFQSVPLPAGASQISFAFEPPYVRYGWAAAFLALIILASYPSIVRRWFNPDAGRDVRPV